jgi:hypothetical protein
VHHALSSRSAAPVQGNPLWPPQGWHDQAAAKAEAEDADGVGVGGKLLDDQVVILAGADLGVEDELETRASSRPSSPHEGVDRWGTLAVPILPEGKRAGGRSVE